MIDNTYIDKAGEIQKSLFPKSKNISFSDVRRKDLDKAIKMAEYMYKFAKANTEEALFLNQTIERLNRYDEKDRPRILGLVLEMQEIYGDRLDEDELREIAAKWGVEILVERIYDDFFKKEGYI